MVYAQLPEWIAGASPAQSNVCPRGAMVDTADLGSVAIRYGGSSPLGGIQGSVVELEYTLG